MSEITEEKNKSMKKSTSLLIGGLLVVFLFLMYATVHNYFWQDSVIHLNETKKNLNYSGEFSGSLGFVFNGLAFKGKIGEDKLRVVIRSNEFKEYCTQNTIELMDEIGYSKNMISISIKKEIKIIEYKKDVVRCSSKIVELVVDELNIRQDKSNSYN